MVATNFVSQIGDKISSSAVDAAFAQALTADGGDASAAYATAKASIASGVIAVQQLFSNWFGDVIHVKAYAPMGGNPAAGNNIQDDTAALTAVFNEANARSLAGGAGGFFPVEILFPPGLYLVSGPLPALVGPVRLRSTGGPRSTIINFIGTGAAGSAYDGITFKGIGAPSAISCSAAAIEGIGLFSYGMTGGNQLVFDFCTFCLVKNVLSAGSFNFCSTRQVNTLIFEDVLAQGISGAYGIKAYGTETSRTGMTRNGAQDWVSLLGLYRVTLIGNNIPGSVVGTPDLLLLDGSVQTLNFNTLILLQGLRGIHSTNTPAVPNPLFLSFLWGQNLQCESFYAEPIRLECCNSAEMSTVYAVGSETTNGIYVGANANEISIRGGRVQQNYAHGWLLDGCQQVDIISVSTWGNSQSGSGLADAIHIQGASDRIKVIGGLAGKRQNNPVTPGGSTQYAELQAFGVHNAGTGARITVSDVDLTGNVTGTTSGTMYVGGGCFTS